MMVGDIKVHKCVITIQPNDERIQMLRGLRNYVGKIVEQTSSIIPNILLATFHCNETEEAAIKKTLNSFAFTIEPFPIIIGELRWEGSIYLSIENENIIRTIQEKIKKQRVLPFSVGVRYNSEIQMTLVQNPPTSLPFPDEIELKNAWEKESFVAADLCFGKSVPGGTWAHYYSFNLINQTSHA